MTNASASKAGSEDEIQLRTDAIRKGRHAIFVDSPPAHAGIVAALRSAFSEGERLPDNDDDGFAELLARLN